MNILIVSHSTDQSGAVELLEDYFVHKKKYQCDKLTHPLIDYENMNTKFFSNGMVVKSITRKRSLIPNLLKDFAITTGTVMKTRPQVCIGANNFDAMSLVVACKLTRKYNPVLIYFASDFSIHRFSSQALNSLYMLVERYALKHSSITISNTSRSDDKRKELGLLKEKSLVIPNGVHIPNYKALKKKINPRQFVYVGNITKGHGLYDFVTSNAGNIDKLTILGEGDDLERTLELCKELLIEYEYMGVVSKNETVTFLSEFRGLGLALYNTSEDHIYYGSSLKLVEYISNGVPPITTGVTELSTRIHKEELGIVVDGSDSNVKLETERFEYQNYHVKAKKFYEQFDTHKLYRVLDKRINEIC